LSGAGAPPVARPCRTRRDGDRFRVPPGSHGGTTPRV
jgi:hypothetical protein